MNFVDTTAVIALAAIPPTYNTPMEVGGFVSSSLDSVYAIQRNSDVIIPLKSDGNYISLSYNPQSRCVLLSTRPGRFPTARHVLCELAASTREPMFSTDKHFFSCGHSGSLMSMSCQVVMPDGEIWVERTMGQMKQFSY